MKQAKKKKAGKARKPGKHVPGKVHLIILACIIILFFALVAFFAGHHNGNSEEIAKPAVKSVRSPAVAGEFYPASGKELGSMVDTFIGEAKPPQVSNLRALIEPHAGYVYSGPTAAYGYKLLKNASFKTVIIIGPSHYAAFYGASIDNVTHYRTPLGEVELSPKAAELAKEKYFTYVPLAHDREHSVEVELPFLQRTLKDFKIIPIVVGNIDPAKLADILIKYIDDDTLIVASSDLSHYYPYDKANQLDSICTESVPALNFTEAKDCQACGIIPILTLMHIAQEKGWEGKLLDHRNSGDTAGDKSSVVGYMSVAFYGGDPAPVVNKDEQKQLLALARQTLDSYLSNGKLPDVDEKTLPAPLLLKKGCFVTLEENDQLRGCIGHIIPQEALYKCVMDNAVNAAVNDMRFNKVDYGELDDISIEISVLTVPEKLEFNSGDELKSLLTPDVDGVILKQGMHQSTYLPQVWESLPDKETFLSSLCLKGGMAAGCWKDTKTEAYTYHAQVFGED